MAQRNLRQELLAAFRGERPDRIPFTIYFCLIPDAEPLDGIAYGSNYDYAHVPAREPAVAGLHEQRGLAFIGWFPAHEQSVDGVRITEQEITRNGLPVQCRRIETPVGTVTEEAQIDPTYGSRWVLKHLIKSVDDYRVMQYVYDHTMIEPAYNAYRVADAAMGDKGVVLAEILPIPLQWLLVEVMGSEAWSEGLLVHTAEFEVMLQSLQRVYMRQVEIAADSPAQAVWLPDNLTGTYVSPTIFDKYCAPVYDAACTMLQQAGKLTLAHCDGCYTQLKEQIGRTKIDVIEAFTPPPMEMISVAEARAAWPTKVLSINVPGILFTEPREVIIEHVRRYLDEASATTEAFVVGCTENYDVLQFDHAFTAIADAIESV